MGGADNVSPGARSDVETAVLSAYKNPLFEENKWVIYPDNTRITYWDYVIGFIVICNCFTIPYQVGVNGSNGSMVFGAISTTLFVCDTIMNFFRAYYDSKGILVYQHKRIMRHYLCTWFFIDALGCFPYGLIILATGQTDSLLSVFALFRLFRLSHLMRLLQNSVVINLWILRLPVVVTGLSQTLIFLILVNHWFACLWAFIARLEKIVSPDSTTWIDKYVHGADTGLDPLSNPIDRYFLSLYWSIMTITSIGYGDVTPYTITEYICCCVLMLIGGIMWAYIIGTVISIVDLMAAPHNKLLNDINNFNSVMDNVKKRSEMDDEEKRSMDAARWYMYFKYRYKTMNSKDELDSVADAISPARKKTLNFTLLETLVSNSISTHKLLHSDFTIAASFLVDRIQTTTLGTNEVFVLSSQLSDDKRLLIKFVRGIVLMTANSPITGHRHLRVIHAGAMINEDEIWVDSSQDTNTTSMVFGTLCFTELIALTRADLLEACHLSAQLRGFYFWKRAKLVLMNFSREYFANKHNPEALKKLWLPHEPELLEAQDYDIAEAYSSMLGTA